MADLFKLNAIDTDKQEQGKWFQYGDEEDGCAFLLAMIPNPAYETFMEETQKKHMRKFRKGEISRLAREHLLKEAVAETVIIDWKGVEWKGKKLKHSKENALMILKDKQAGRSILEWIFNEAGTRDEFLLEEFEEDVKN